MILQKWDEKKHEYLPFESPAEILFLFTEHMGAPVDCANCGARQVFGDCYTSQTIHNEMGLGYPVCGACYEVETKERLKHRKES